MVKGNDIDICRTQLLTWDIRFRMGPSMFDS